MNEKLKDKYRTAKGELDANITKTLVEEPTKSYRTVATEFSVGVDWVIAVEKRHGIKRSRGRKPGIPNSAEKDLVNA